MNRMEFLVLQALAGESRHGYGLVREIERITQGQVKARPGNLYRVLDRLLKRGWIREAGHEAGQGGQGRRLYRVTEGGRREARAEVRLMQGILAEAALESASDSI